MELKAMIETGPVKLDPEKVLVEEVQDGLVLVVYNVEGELIAAVFGRTDRKSPTLTGSTD